MSSLVQVTLAAFPLSKNSVALLQERSGLILGNIYFFENLNLQHEMPT